ncbi:2-phospho-L-lactate guanylyltransferase [Ornithinimicrobium humiphilum]|uniref:2-phospho-L-lactate guanylyltransferase n=1 Tax=Ornithinimicrobium humiphilum TaxID=125288 RepID=A0A543KQC7_9MICO|nr:2-phospho-L-lactate guanylyltransferase [Ornithinimicrobium humiphilum]
MVTRDPHPFPGTGSAPAGTTSTRPGGVYWHLVVPVKDASLAKSRLEAPAPLRRADLARAVAADTVEAACAAVGAESLTVVTSDEVVASLASGLGARVVADPGDGLDAAVAAGWRDEPDLGGRRIGWAALLGDLAALRPEDLHQALAACAGHRAAVVPDAEGTGTVLLTSTTAPPQGRFGPGSAARHEAAGAVRLELDLPRLRRDVDVAADLRSVLALGAGPHTLLATARGA